MGKTQHRVLITGAGGFIGSKLVQMLATQQPKIYCLATARRPIDLPAGENLAFAELDIRDAAQAETLMREHRITSVVHLASVVTPKLGMTRATMHAIDVGGTQAMLDASLAAGVGQFIVTTSAASYGYHADNPVPLTEDDALRGNEEFAYADHKRQIEALLTGYRRRHPQLRQLLFRPGFVLGYDCDNQITNLFKKRAVFGVRGASSPFTIIWDDDVCACLVQGIMENKAGIYNLTGDGFITLHDIANILGKPYISVPAGLIQIALFVGKQFGLTEYGPEQLNFLRYRPVLSNQRLKEEFGYQPARSSRECFVDYARHAGLIKPR